jgi:hypothetical protein
VLKKIKKFKFLLILSLTETTETVRLALLAKKWLCNSLYLESNGSLSRQYSVEAAGSEESDDEDDEKE